MEALWRSRQVIYLNDPVRHILTTLWRPDRLENAHVFTHLHGIVETVSYCAGYQIALPNVKDIEGWSLLGRYAAKQVLVVDLLCPPSLAA